MKIALPSRCWEHTAQRSGVLLCLYLLLIPSRIGTLRPVQQFFERQSLFVFVLAVVVGIELVLMGGMLRQLGSMSLALLASSFAANR